MMMMMKGRVFKSGCEGTLLSKSLRLRPGADILLNRSGLYDTLRRHGVFSLGGQSRA